MEFHTNATKTLRTLLEQFKPMQSSQQDPITLDDGSETSSIESDHNKSSPTPSMLYKVSPSASFSLSSQSPTMVYKSSPKADPAALYKLELTPHLSEDGGIIRRTRTVIPYSVKCQISSLAEENPRITQGEIAQIFGIDRTTVSKILKRRRDFLDESSAGPKAKSSRLSTKEVSDELELAVYDWYKTMKDKNVMVTQAMIMDAAVSLSQKYNIDKSDISKQWLVGFLNRYKITCKDVFLADVDVLNMQKSVHENSYNKALQHIASLASHLSQKPSNSSPSYLMAGDTEARSGGMKAGKAQKMHMNNHSSGVASSTNSNAQRQIQPKPTSMPIPNHALSTGNKIPRNRVPAPLSEQPDKVTETPEPEVIHIKQEAEETPELNDEEALSREIGNLEKFREQQKMIEEANKQRKALLAKTLSERQRRAREEAQKLAHIQKELQLLDNRLSADVTVIRSRIEVASREFLDAQKRYDKAEREFIESKIDLQKKSELKEQLTEHLYTIIHQNEVRKAQKLSELMTELELEAKEDGVQLPKLPPLSTFSTINALQTLHSPKSPSENVPVTGAKSVKDLVIEKIDSSAANCDADSVSKKTESDVVHEKSESKRENEQSGIVYEQNKGTTAETKRTEKEINEDLDIIPIDLSASSPEYVREEGKGDNPVSPQNIIPTSENEKESRNEVQSSTGDKLECNSQGAKNLVENVLDSDNSDRNKLCVSSVQTINEIDSKDGSQNNEKTQADLPSTWTLNVVSIKDEPVT